MSDSILNTVSSPITLSAPGKVILFGEHSVVYGKQAIALSINLRTKVKIMPSGKLCINFPDISVSNEWALGDLQKLWINLKLIKKKKCDGPSVPTEKTMNVIKEFLGIDLKPELTNQDNGLLSFFFLYSSILHEPVFFSINIESQIPIGSGMGSSAAYSVCLAAGLLIVSGSLNTSSIDSLSMDDSSESVDNSMSSNSRESYNLISNWALMCEKIFHGTPSGIDNTTSCFGGTVCFNKIGMKSLTVPAIRVMLVNTKVTRSTKLLAANVRLKYNRHKLVVEHILSSMDEIAKSALSILEEFNAGNSLTVNEEHRCKLNELVVMNQSLLEALGTSHPCLRKMIDIAIKNGFSAKLTGAGGGGCGIILLPSCDLQTQKIEEKIRNCESLLRAEGFDIWVTELGVKGVSMESNS